MDDAAMKRIAERIAERKRLGLTAGQFDAQVSERICDAAREMKMAVARSFVNTYEASRNSRDPAVASEYRRRADAAVKASIEAEEKRVAAVEYAKKFGVIVRR